MDEFRNTDEITKEDLEKMYNAIVKFDNNEQNKEYEY